MSIRICTKCKLEKDLLNDYHRCQKNELRRKTVCKPCACLSVGGNIILTLVSHKWWLVWLHLKGGAAFFKIT